MSKQPAVPSAAQVQGVQFVNDFVTHPDFRLFASFSLGWVFLSSLRHIWMSAFIRDLVWVLVATSGRLRGKVESVTPTDLLHEKSTGAHRPSSVCTAELYRRKQWDTLRLLLCMAFLLASLTSFLSLLIFSPNDSGAACVLLLLKLLEYSALLILGLNLRHRMAGSRELWMFWSFLAIATALNGVTVGLGPGRLVTPLMLPSISLCFRKRFLPTSLVGSILNIVLELYILIRIISLMKPPRMQCATIQDTLVVQAGSLLLFDLLVIVPEAILTGLIAEFIPFSIGALTVLVAFHSPFGQSTFHPTRLDDPDLTSRPSIRVVVPPEPPILQGDIPNRLIHIENHPSSAIALAVHDTEAGAATSLSPRAAPQGSSLSNEVLWETNPVALPQPAEISVQTTIASPASQPDAGDLSRREKILSYSSPIWATFGTREQNNIGGPSRPQILIECTGSPQSSNPSSEQDGRVQPSPSSTILGSDIIRGTPSHYGRDRMRIHHSVPSSTLSPTSPIPSPLSQSATHQSWASSLSAHPPISENKPQSGSIPPKETTQWLGPTTSRSYKSRQGSKASRSSRSSKKSSIRSAKAAIVPTGEGNLRRYTMFRAVSSRLSRGFPAKTRHTRPVGVVRGPRPSPSASRSMGEGHSEGR